MSNVPKLRFKEFTDEWEEKELGNICDILSGKRIPKGMSLTEHNTGIPYITVSDMGYKYINKSNIKYITSEIEQSIKKYKVLTNDIIISVAGTLGKINIVQYELENANLTENCNKLTNFRGVYYNYIYYYLNTLYIQNQIVISNTVSSQPKLALERIRKFSIYIPSLQEQEKIASFLSLIDKKINLQTEKVKALKDYKKGLMQKIFSRELRFKDENGNEFPEWEVTSIEKIANLEKGFTPNTSDDKNWNGSIIWVSIADMKKNKYIENSSKHITKEALGNKKLIPINTLIMSFKLTLGRLAITNTPMITNEAICHFYWKNNNVDTEYMYYYLNTVNIESFGCRATKGITLNNDSLNSIVVSLPILEEQRKISELLKVIDEKVDKEQEKLNLLNDYKKGLLQQMFI